MPETSPTRSLSQLDKPDCIGQDLGKKERSMIYLVRTAKMLRGDEGFEQATKKLIAHLREAYPQIKDIKFLSNITGPVNMVHWVMVFDSLSDEDEWATKILHDPVYHAWFEASVGVMDEMVDRLYRESST